MNLDHDLEALLGDPALWHDPGPELRAAVLRAASGTDPVAALAPAPEGVRRTGSRRRGATAVPGGGRPWAPARPWWSPPRWVLVPGLAGVLAVAVAVGAVLRPSEPQRAELALAAADGTVVLVADVTANDAGWRLDVDARGLPALADGRVYEVRVDVDGREVSAGTFRAGDRVTLWSGVERLGGRTVTLLDVPATPGGPPDRIVALRAGGAR
ncbi:MAG: hypothetical protein AB7L84_00775 [Acidimicrobiia bacterium]